MALYLIFGFVLLAVIVLAVLWLLQRKKAKAAAGADVADAGGAGTEEIDTLVREAERRMAASKQGDRLGNLPIFFLVGDTGSTKTSVMVNAGLEPELLAGLVYRDNNLVPTRTANLWFARRTIFVEAGGKLPAEPAKWVRLVRKLQPRAGVASRGAQAPRAVLVCYDSENFTRPGAQESATAAARNLRARLGEMSQALGINLPVYVLFTKMDRLPFFTEFVRNLTKDEATQVLGATFPMRDRAARRGVWRRADRAADGEFRTPFPFPGRRAAGVPGSRNRRHETTRRLRISARVPQDPPGRGAVPGGPVPAQPVDGGTVSPRILFHGGAPRGDQRSRAGGRARRSRRRVMARRRAPPACFRRGRLRGPSRRPRRPAPRGKFRSGCS